MLGRALKSCLAACLVIGAFGLPAANAATGTLYTNDYSGKQISSFSIGADGLLSPLASSPLATPNYPNALAITPNGQTMVMTFLYEHSVGSAWLAPDGSPSIFVPPQAISAPAGVAISPDESHAFVSLQSGGVLVYAIAPGGGGLAFIGGPFGSADGYAAVTPDGRYLFAPSYTDEAIERFAILPDGSLAPLGPLGSTPVPGVHPQLARVTPDGRYAVLLSDVEGPDDLRTFAIEAGGTLSPTGSDLETTGAVTGPPVISPNGRFLFAANGNEGSVTAYSIGADGALAQVGEPVPTELSSPQGIAMSVDGRFLYVEPIFGNLIQAFSVGADGSLTKIGEPTTTGESDGSTPLARPSAPTASFTVRAGAPRAKTTFNAIWSLDSPPYEIVSYAWDFGDGTKQTSTSPKVTHTYRKAGVYEAKLSATDDNGCHGFSYTGQSAYCGGSDATRRVDTPPAIFSLEPTPRRFFATRAARRRRTGTTFHFKLSEKAKVRFIVKRKRAGRKPKQVGAFRARGLAGKNRKRFAGKLKGRSLPPGRYVAIATATDSTGGKSTPRSAMFEVKKP